MQFENADDLRAVIEQTKLFHDQYCVNIAKIDSLANGEPPYTQQEQLDNNLDCNCNFLETTRALADARKSWYGASLGKSQYFKVTIDHKNRRANEWGQAITRAINKVLKASIEYTELKMATGAQVVSHGIGPMMWEDDYKWLPEEIGIQDLMVPPGTRKNLRNLKQFFVYRKYTTNQLWEMTHGKHVDPGWNMEVVDAELKRLANEYLSAGSLRDTENPVRLEELFNTSSGYMESAAVPTVDVWDSYWQGEKKEADKWHRGIVLDTVAAQGKFLYRSKGPVSEKRQHRLHISFGDGATQAPFMYHAIRALGKMLYSPGHLQNRTRSRINDAIMENSVMGFRITNADDRSRLQKIDLFSKGVMYIPQGLEIIPESERRSINQELVFAGLAQNRQLMGEASSQYVQDVEQGSTREQTATEVMAKVNSANAIVSGMRLMQYEYDQQEYHEICRRFTLKGSDDDDVKKFHQQMRNEGVPEEVLFHVERWNIAVERALGGGNKMLAIAEADKLMAVRPQLDPDAQRIVTRMFIEANSDNPNLPDQLVPPAPPPITASRHDGQLAAGAILQGLPVQTRPGTNHIDYVEALLTALAASLKLIQSTGGMASQAQILGLGALATAIQGEIQQIAQDPQEADRAKKYTEALTQMGSMIQALAAQLQKQMQQAQQQNGQNGEAAAKVQSMLIQAQAKGKIAEASAAQKREHKQAGFVEGEKRKDIETALKARRDLTEAQIDAQATDLKTAAAIRSKRASAEATSNSGNE